MESISTYHFARDQCIVSFTLPAPGKMGCQSVFGPRLASGMTISERFIGYWLSLLSARLDSNLVNRHDRFEQQPHFCYP